MSSHPNPTDLGLQLEHRWPRGRPGWESLTPHHKALHVWEISSVLQSARRRRRLYFYSVRRCPPCDSTRKLPDHSRLNMIKTFQNPLTYLWERLRGFPPPELLDHRCQSNKSYKEGKGRSRENNLFGQLVFKRGSNCRFVYFGSNPGFVLGIV